MDYYDDNDNDNASRPDESSQDGYPSGNPDGYQPGSYSKKSGRPVPQTNRMALFSMLCGLFGFLSLLCCIAFPAAILLGAAGISLACLSKKGGPFSGLAIAGLVLGILSVLLGAAECAYLIFVNQMLQDPEMARIFEQILEEYGG